MLFAVFQKHHLERRFLRRTECRNLSSVKPCDTLCNGKPQPVPAGAGISGILQTIKTLKDTKDQTPVT